MKKIDFNDNWLCTCLTREEPPCRVTLPHDAMLSEPRTQESQGAHNIGWFLGGDYEYTKSFWAEEDWKHKSVILEFEGVYKQAEVFVNGQKAAFRPYGYTNFYVPLNDCLKYNAENEIRVIAHNSDHPNSRWYSGTGIYRPVFLHIGDEKCIPINGIKIRTLSIHPATVEVSIQTSQPGEVQIEILKDGQILKSGIALSINNIATYQFTLNQAKLWSCDTPELYSCRITFGNDVVTETFGIRIVKWDSKNGLTINNERIIIRGACIHHDNGLLGACAFPEAEERKVRILKENGYNAIRSAHNPCSKAMLDACDRLGVLMLDEYADVWYVHKTKYDYVNFLMDWWQQDLKDMVDKDYNHPSVIMYSTGNEVSETAQPKGIELTRTFTEYLHALDPSRAVTCSINIFFNFLSSVGFGVYSDEKAEKEAQNTAKKKKKAVGSEFYNTLACLVGDYFMKCGATLPPCDWKTKDAYANVDVAGYNYGLFRYRHDLKKYPDRLILGSETFCKDAYAFWEIARDNPRLIGDFVWPAFEYIGETVGAPEFASYVKKDPTTHLTGGCGRIDLIGKPNCEAFYTRVAFERETGPRMAIIPVSEKKNIRMNGWQLTKAKESWSWNGYENTSFSVDVYAKAASVALFLNGTLIAKKKCSKRNCITAFTLNYEPGELMAVSYDANNREINRYILKTADSETVLSAKPEKTTADPNELIFIPLQYTDKKAIWKPLENHTIHCTVNRGTLVALGSANPYLEGKMTTKETATFFGDALAVIRADKNGHIDAIFSDGERKTSVIIPHQGY